MEDKIILTEDEEKLMELFKEHRDLSILKIVRLTVENYSWNGELIKTTLAALCNKGYISGYQDNQKYKICDNAD